MAHNKDKVASLLESLDALIHKHHLLKHPFYRDWVEGKLPLESLALYAEQYYQHVRAFPENLRQLASRTDGNLRELIEKNLAEELDAVAPHPMLWRQFAQSLGVGEIALDDAQPLPGISALLDHFDDLAERGTMAEAVAAFYAYESQVPEIAAKKMEGLKKFYGITEARALAYFAVHEQADVRHRAAWRHWLATHKSVDPAEVLSAAERTLKALWGALDAVYPNHCALKAHAARN